MVIIRLTRSGARNKPFYKIVACDSRGKAGGKYLDSIGYWHPAKNTLEIKKEVLAKWVKVGAKLTPAVQKLIAKIK